MHLSVSIQDKITPDLARRLKALGNRRPILEAMGQAVVSLAKRAFSEPGLRPTPWLPRKGNYPGSILRRRGDLWQSIHAAVQGNDSVAVGTPKAYGLFHQFGTRKSARHAGLPPRPFFPIMGQADSGRLTARADQAVLAALEAALPKA